MRPDDPQMKNPSIFVPQRPTLSSQGSRQTNPAQQQATADLARNQIDAIYNNDKSYHEPHTSAAQTTSQDTSSSDDSNDSRSNDSPHAVITDKKAQYQQSDEPTNPYDRTHDDTNLHTTNDDAWGKYHSAWQKYYQEYFHRYYNAHLEQTKAAFAEQSSKLRELEEKVNTQGTKTPAAAVTPEEAMDEIRGSLRDKVRQGGKKVRKSKHFVPIVAACAVMLLFVGLQYNRVIFGYANAYIAPGSVDPANIIVDPNLSMNVGSDPRLIIPKINIDVPAIYENTMGSSQIETYNRQMTAMEKGVAWFGIPGANAKPGQNGNTVLSGHSSNDWFDGGEIKFVFANLHRLTEGDTIYAHYGGIRYAYVVSGTSIVMPSELDALRVGNDKPMLTLITCTPLGTSEKRLLVFAEQVSPDPLQATPAPQEEPAQESSEIPGVRTRVLGIF